MKKHSGMFAASVAAVVVTFSAGLAFAQTAPAAGTAATPPAAVAPATPAPAVSSAPAATPAPTAATPAPATTTPSTAAETKEAKPTKKKQRMTRQQEIEHSIKTGTVPSRFRSSVPKAYQRYIPFEKK